MIAKFLSVIESVDSTFTPSESRFRLRTKSDCILAKELTSPAEILTFMCEL
jgi:hypothetical protein